MQLKLFDFSILCRVAHFALGLNSELLESAEADRKRASEKKYDLRENNIFFSRSYLRKRSKNFFWEILEQMKCNEIWPGFLSWLQFSNGEKIGPEIRQKS